MATGVDNLFKFIHLLEEETLCWEHVNPVRERGGEPRNMTRWAKLDRLYVAFEGVAGNRNSSLEMTWPSFGSRSVLTCV